MGPLSQATRLFNWLEDQTPAGIFELYVLLESVRTAEVRVSLTVSSPSLSFSRAKTKNQQESRLTGCVVQAARQVGSWGWGGS